MDEVAVSLLRQISDRLSSIDNTMAEINQGVAMLIDKDNGSGEVCDKLDDIAGGVGDINVKMRSPSVLDGEFEAIRANLDNLPAEIASAIEPIGTRRSKEPAAPA